MLLLYSNLHNLFNSEYAFFVVAVSFVEPEDSTLWVPKLDIVYVNG